MKTLQGNITAVRTQNDILPTEVIDERLHDLQSELQEKSNQKGDYYAIANEIIRLKQSEADSVVKDEQMRLFQDLQDFIKNQLTTITEFDETLVRYLITRITVFEDHFQSISNPGSQLTSKHKTSFPAAADGNVGVILMDYVL